MSLDLEFLQEIIYLKNIKYGAYLLKLDEHTDVGTHWIALYCKYNEMFISIVVELNMFLKEYQETYL